MTLLAPSQQRNAGKLKCSAKPAKVPLVIK
jgi:hypothetical protein